MSDSHRSSSIPFVLAITGLFCAAPAFAQSREATEQAFDAVDRVLARKDLNNIPDYKDDRSTSEALIESFYNAINRGEFSRAFSYYSDGNQPDFGTWIGGYENTKAIKLVTGPAEGDPGAGVLYWHQPVAIEAETYDGKKEVFGGCYEISMAAPLNQEAPPFRPMSISSGLLKKSTKKLEESVPESCMPD